MTPSARRARTRAASALASAAVTGVAIACMGAIWSAPSKAQGLPCPPSCDTTTTTTTTTIDTTTSTPTTPTTAPDPAWDGSRWTGPRANNETVTDGTFSGTFVHQPPTPPIDTVDLTVSYAAGDLHGAACGTGPGKQPQQSAPTTTTPSGSETDTMDFLFEVAFTCNGLYDATATARLKGAQDEFTKHALELRSLHVAVPPQSPLTFLATDNGNQTVTTSWQAPGNAPPDLLGYRVSRRTASQGFTPIGDVPPETLTFTDTKLPPTGGSFFYQVETMRKSPNGTLFSIPVVTSEALAVGGGSNAGTGRSVTGQPAPQAPGDGNQHFEQTTLAADEGEPGSGDLALPGAGTIQRFAGRDGAGLIKPFAAALDLAVWAGLLLFLTRRAARAARADALAVEFEHSS
jgi:hypothetical protein